MTTFESRTISVSINRPPREVYDFAATPENLPQWATGLGTSGERVGDVWLAQTPQATIAVRFVDRNDLGVLDHYVRVGSEAQAPEIYNPMRVVANGEGSEVSFTLFRQPGVPDAKFEEDAAWVKRDLKKLKALLEG